MLVLKLGQGYFDCIEPSGHCERTYFRSTDCCIGSLHYDDSLVMDAVPIEAYYQACCRRGYSQEQIIDALLVYYHRFRYFRIGYLSARELTIGFIGHRGSGKSVSAAALAIVDFLLCGYSVWSNMNVEVAVVYGDAMKVFRAYPLDKLELLQKTDYFRHGLVLLDEVNVSFADATLYMSKTNRELSNFTQQIRKRGLSLVWTAQNWNSIDNRLRFQSDFVIWCEDAYLRHPGVSKYMGEVSQWMVFDSSGMSGNISLEDEWRNKYLIDKMVWRGNFHSRPWWNSYNTYETQGKEAYSMKDLEKMRQAKYFGDVAVPDSGLSELANRIKVLTKPNDHQVIYCDEFWAFNGITNKAEQTRYGIAFKEAGFEHLRDKNKKYYWQRLDK